MKRLVILGAGESGCGAAVLGKAKGMDVFVSDNGPIADKYKNMLNERGIPFEENGHTPELILNADEVVKSPGIPPTAPLVRQLAEKGTPIISEIELYSSKSKARSNSVSKTPIAFLVLFLSYARLYPKS